MTGSKYAVAVAQLEDHEAINMDACMFFMKIQEEHLDVIIVIMTQLLLKEGLKWWGTKSHNTVQSEMKQLHFRYTLKPIHWKELDDTQRNIVF